MEKVKVIILHSDTLLSIGLQKILNDMFSIKAAHYSVTPNETAVDEADLIILSSDIFVRDNDLLASRKHKLIFITENLPDSSNGYNYICRNWSEERIIQQLNTYLCKLDDIKSVHNELSKREIDVLRLVAKGLINRDIADKLNISINTVLSHRKNITSKLGIKSVSGLSVYAMMNGLISTD